MLLKDGSAAVKRVAKFLDASTMSALLFMLAGWKMHLPSLVAATVAGLSTVHVMPGRFFSSAAAKSTRRESYFAKLSAIGAGSLRTGGALLGSVVGPPGTEQATVTMAPSVRRAANTGRA